ncbi:hypothetical protein BDV97DRAFT_174375 [Delphinella strobiligena]|nr:hypothetical protein BDV97DRAFT_174375 [Delphinella strobiligena]
MGRPHHPWSHGVFCRKSTWFLFGDKSSDIEAHASLHDGSLRSTIHMICYPAAIQETHQPKLQLVSKLGAQPTPSVAHAYGTKSRPCLTLKWACWVVSGTSPWKIQFFGDFAASIVYLLEGNIAKNSVIVQIGEELVEKRSTTMTDTSFWSWWLKCHRFDHQPSTHNVDTIFTQSCFRGKQSCIVFSEYQKSGVKTSPRAFAVEELDRVILHV